MMTFKDMKNILDKMTPEQLEYVVYCEGDGDCTESNIKGIQFVGGEPFIILSPH